MRIGLMLNVLVQYSECFIEVIKAFEKRGTIKFVFKTLKGPWLDTDYVKKQLQKPFQLRLIQTENVFNLKSRTNKGGAMRKFKIQVENTLNNFA